ncbi:hypothetical protein BRADI_3g00942v3, partial [Brachypodium distachyon]
IIYRSSAPSSSAMVYSSKVEDRLQLLTGEAAASPQRFAASSMADDPPYVLMQSTWDLTSDKCKQCLDVLLANASDWFSSTGQGKHKTFSCTVRYSNTSFMVLPFSNGAPAPSAPSTFSNGAPAPSGSLLPPTSSVFASTSRRVKEDVELKEQSCQTLTTVTTQVFVPKSFTYQELAHAISDFTETKKLGEGGFGVVYEGTVPGIEGTVAIKKIKLTWLNEVRGKRDFDNEINIMSKLHHKNILRLLGWCDEGDHLLLIYETMKNGNLEDQLYPKINGATDARINDIDWPERHNVLIGIASGLAYLHTECLKSIVHRDIRPGNVLLDMDFNAKLSDFGLVREISHTQTSHETSTVIGSRSYIEPTFVETGKACAQSDVYSLGVMLLEIVCGEKPIILHDGKNSLIEKVQRCQERNAILEAADKRLKGRRFDDEITRVLELGLMCVHSDRHLRPHIQRLRDSLTQLTAGPWPSAPNGSGADASISNNRQPRADEEAGVTSLLVRRPTL